MNKIITVFIFLYCQINYSQELFVVTDPASNIPTNTLKAVISSSTNLDKIISIDETAIYVNMVREHGRNDKGSENVTINPEYTKKKVTKAVEPKKVTN